jgi:arginyl-tRNA synthetase
LTWLLGELPEIVNSCCNQYSPHPLAHYIYDVGQAVNHFYQKIRIKDLESPLKDLYLHILEGSVVVLTNGLKMLNIDVPERM